MSLYYRNNTILLEELFRYALSPETINFSVGMAIAGDLIARIFYLIENRINTSYALAIFLAKFRCYISIKPHGQQFGVSIFAKVGHMSHDVVKGGHIDISRERFMTKFANVHSLSEPQRATKESTTRPKWHWQDVGIFIATIRLWNYAGYDKAQTIVGPG